TNFELPLGVKRLERSEAIENKSAHGEPVEQLELASFVVSAAMERLERLKLPSGVAVYFSESESRSTRTVVIPDPTMPRTLAAARETSIIRPFPNGPRSLIRTSTDFPLVRLVTFTRLPQGRVR